MIGDDIEVAVVDIRGDAVRLGITAPRETPVHRREIWLDTRGRSDAGDAPAPRAAISQPTNRPGRGVVRR